MIKKDIFVLLILIEMIEVYSITYRLLNLLVINPKKIIIMNTFESEDMILICPIYKIFF